VLSLGQRTGHLNTKIRFREPFRPFAPVVLEEQADEYYAGVTDVRRHYPVRYMLMVFPVREDKQEMILAFSTWGSNTRGAHLFRPFGRDFAI
jgi:carbamoyltransferase